MKRIIWITTFTLPNVENFDERQVVQSTKIYDRTGEKILFDVRLSTANNLLNTIIIHPNTQNKNPASPFQNRGNHEFFPLVFCALISLGWRQDAKLV